jgi:hypothetical protein
MPYTVLSAAAFETDLIRLSKFHANVDRYIELGVGVLESMYRLGALGESLHGKDILFVGTAGILGPFSNPWLVTVESVEWLPTGDRLGHSYSVPKHPPLSTRSIPSLVAKLPVARCFCGPSVSIDSQVVETLTVSSIENIELYGVAQRILPCARSFSVILGVTNAVGPESHAQWKSNWKECAKMTADYLNRYTE